VADPIEPSLKTPDPFPPWPDIPDLRESATYLLDTCVEAGLLTPDAPGVRELLDLLHEHPKRPELLLQRAEGMLAELGREAGAHPFTHVDGQHAFWLSLVAALLHRRCLGDWPALPTIKPLTNPMNAVLDLRVAAHYQLAAAGVIPYPLGGDPAP